MKDLRTLLGQTMSSLPSDALNGSISGLVRESMCTCVMYTIIFHILNLQGVIKIFIDVNEFTAATHALLRCA